MQYLIEQARKDELECWEGVPCSMADCVRFLVKENAALEADNASLRQINEMLDAKLAELERLEPKPLTEEQRDFEAWYFDKYLRPPARDEDGFYKTFHARDAWEGWQAHATRSNRPPTQPKT